MLVARRNPGQQHQTSEMYLEVGRSVSSRNRPERNANADAVKQQLNDAAGLPGLDLTVGTPNVPFSERPSFRDMVAFNFQPQHIVANPYTLFFKADTYQHREKLKAVMPLALGTRSVSDLEDQRDLDNLRRELAQRKREMETRRVAFEGWVSEVQSFHVQAVELGLLNPTSESTSDWTVDRFISELSTIPALTRRDDLPSVREGGTEDAVDVLLQVISEEEQVAEQMGIRRRRLEGIERLRQSVGDYGSELSRQSHRVEGLGWFLQSLVNESTCPLCLSPQTRSIDTLRELESYAGELRAMTDSVRLTPGILDKERTELSAEIRALEARLAACRKQRGEMEDQSEQQAARRQRLSEIYRLAGRIEQALANIEAMDADGELQAAISNLENRISVLRKRLDGDAYKHRQDAALEKVSRLIGEYSSMLELERTEDVVQLDVTNLTLQFSSATGRLDYLWELGSGANWMGCHIATMLALHEYFLSLSTCPVPSFLVLDQPSQVYFPERFPDSEDDLAVYRRETASADVEGVKRVFRALSSANERTKGRLQIIITEHAGEFVWRGLPNVHNEYNWHGDTDYLIPRDWLDEGQ